MSFILACYLMQTVQECRLAAFDDFALNDVQHLLHDLVLQFFFWLRDIQRFILGFVSIVLCFCRHLLLSAGVWGDPTLTSKGLLLTRAHREFKGFCRLHRLYCSQPEFRESMASWLPSSVCIEVCYTVCMQLTFDFHITLWCNSLTKMELKSSSLSVCSFTVIFFWMISLCVFWSAELYKKNGDILLTLKAYNGRCVLEWLSHRVHEISQDPQFSSFAPNRFPVIAGCLTLVCIYEQQYEI